MLKADSLYKDIYKEFSNDVLRDYVVDDFSQSIFALQRRVFSNQHERLKAKNKMQDFGKYLISSVYIPKPEVADMVRKEFEPYGYLVEYSAAAGISLYLPKPK